VAPLVPLTSSQLSMLLPPNPFPRNYDLGAEVRFGHNSTVATGALRDAVQAAVGSQAAYRLRFEYGLASFDDGPDAVDVDFRVADDPGTPGNAEFDLIRGPLVRCAAYVDRGFVTRFTLTAPHIVLDGTAQWLLLADVFRALAGEPLTPCGQAEYRQHVADTKALESAATDVFRKETAEIASRWQAGSAGLKPVEWPGLTEPGFHHYPAKAIRRIDPPVTAGLSAMARGLAVNSSDLVLAAFVSCLADVSGDPRIPILLVADVRVPVTDPFAGCFVNTVPLMLRSDPDLQAAAVSAAAAKRIALERRHLPYLEYSTRMSAADPDIPVLLSAAPMVSMRRAGRLTFRGTAADIVFCPPSAWPRAPILLRVINDGAGLIVDVETDHSLPPALSASAVAEALVSRLESSERGRSDPRRSPSARRPVH
jgi:hypothetical protein